MHMFHRIEHGLYFFQLYAVTHVFHLVIGTAFEVQVALFVHLNEVAGAINSFVIAGIVRVLNERLLRALCVIVVSRTYVRASQAQFAEFAGIVGIDEHIAEVGGQVTQRSQVVHIFKIGFGNLVGRADAGTFGRAVNIVQVCCGAV